MQELRKIRASSEQMKRLCDAMQVEKSAFKQDVDYMKVHFALIQRLEEFEKYKQELQHLQLLCCAIDSGIIGKIK